MVRSIRSEHPAEPLQDFRRFAAVFGLLDGTLPYKVQKPRLQVEMGLPEFAIVHVLDPFPDFRFAAVLVPAGAEVTVIEAKHLRRQPGGNMHAVGDMPDGNFVFGTTGIEAGPHGAGNFPVQGGYGIGPPRKLQPQHRHAELLVVIAGMLPSERHEALVGKTENLAQRPQMLLHQSGE